jgi:peptidoglycan/xylan/chitin deacetylase (PgdA/CDA1 family)
MPMVVNAARSIAGRAYWATPHFLSLVQGKVVILMYHRVLPQAATASSFVQPGMYVTPQTFERHLQFLTAHFEVLGIGQLLQAWSSRALRDDARYCAITFDDGWIDNYQHAYPLLRAYNVPATIFLPTDYVGSRERLWPDRLGCLLRRRGIGSPEEWNSTIERAKTLPDEQRTLLIDTIAATVGEGPAERRFLDWDEAREMSRHGIAFGSHTATHANLARASGGVLERELRHPLDVLQRECVNAVRVLAYPNGDYTPEVAAAARAAGYDAAVTVRSGFESRMPGDRFQLKRMAVHEDVGRSGPSLALHLARTAGRGGA